MLENGLVLWFTGLSGAGKTTTACALLESFRADGRKAELLDGDEMRTTISKGLGFSHEDRMENIKRIVYLSKLLSRNGVIVLVSAITPYREMRNYARSELPGYVEVFVDCPLEECERRDVKGLYAQARQSQLPHFTGLSDAYEMPEHPDLVIRTMEADAQSNVSTILDYLAARTGGKRP
jgi:adenylylsulfate kinase